MKQPIPAAAPPISGFTLIELLVALSVLAILLTVGVPSFTNLIANNRATTTANEFLATLQYARSEAVRQNEIITICSSTDGSVCGGSSDWQTGWVVRWQGAPIRVRQTIHAAITVAGPDADGQVQFGSAGQALGGDGEFTVTVTGGAGATRRVCLQPSGRAFVGGC